MQDNNYKDQWDNDFEEFAWQNMRKKLDAEMPVEKKKPRVFFWLWMGGAAVALLLVAYYSSIGSVIKEAPIIQEKNQIPIVLHEQENDILDSKEEVVANNPTQKESMLEALNNDNNNNAKSEKQTVTSNQVQLNNKKTASIIVGKYVLEQSIAVSALEVKEVAKPEKSIRPFPVEIQENNTTQEQQLSSENIEINSLTNLSLSLLTIEEQKEDLVFITKPLSKIKKSKFKWGLMAAIKTDEFLGKNTFSIGFTNEYSFAPKWYLQAGLSYGYKLNNENNIRKQDEMINVPDQNALDSGSAPINSLEEFDFNQQNIYSVFSKKGRYHLLSLPVELGYRISPKFSFSLGGELSYLLKGNIGDVAVVFNDSRSSLGASITNYQLDNNQIFSKSVDEKFVSRWDVLGAVGFNYHPNQKIKIGLQYQYLLTKTSLVNYRTQTVTTSNISKQSLLANGIKLSLNYYFK